MLRKIYTGFYGYPFPNVACRNKRYGKASNKPTKSAQATHCRGSDPRHITAAAQRDQSNPWEPTAVARQQRIQMAGPPFGNHWRWQQAERLTGYGEGWCRGKEQIEMCLEERREEQAAAPSSRWMSCWRKQGTLHPSGSQAHAICPQWPQLQGISLAFI